MKISSWELRFGILLIILSIFLYLTHFLVYKDIADILHWFLKGIAFLPISILFVTLIVNRLLIRRGKKVEWKN